MKNSAHSTDFELLAKTMSGLEEVLAAELEAAGGKDISILNRAVSFRGDLRVMYSANLWCRTALRILKPVSRFTIRGEEDFYRKIYHLPWEENLDPGQTLAIDTVVTDSVFTHSHYTALKAKDAIVDRFRDRTGRRPSVDTDNPDLRLDIHMYRNNVTVSLDSSGGSLHKRGYRKSMGEAPLNEVLAAGLILLSGWDRQCDFIDPMCGSGTLLIEAALIAGNIPPGTFRQGFGFQKWKDYDPGLWNEILKESYSKSVESEGRIIGSDILRESVAVARTNVKGAGMHKDIELIISAFEDTEPASERGVLLINPPYGERIKVDDIVKLYQSIGDTLKRKYSGYQAWVISADLNALKFIGLKPSRKLVVFNGPLECRFVCFDLYQGTRRYGPEAGDDMQ